MAYEDAARDRRADAVAWQAVKVELDRLIAERASQTQAEPTPAPVDPAADTLPKATAKTSPPAPSPQRRGGLNYNAPDDAAIRAFLKEREIELPLSEANAEQLWTWSLDVVDRLPGKGGVQTKRERARDAFRRITGR